MSAVAWAAAVAWTVAAVMFVMAGSWLWICWSLGAAVWVWVANEASR